MKFQEMLSSKIHAGSIIKVVWPERNKIATGHPADFKTEPSMLAANVFDFLITQHDKSICDYDVIVWLTQGDVSMI